MDPAQRIADIDPAQSRDGLCVLDKIYLPYPDNDTWPAVKFGLGAERYLPDIDRTELRERVVRLMADYCRTFPGKVDRYVPSGKSRSVKISGDPTPNVRADFERIPIQNSYGSILLGAVDLGLPKDDVAPYQAHTLVSYPERRKLSFVSAAFPVCNDAGRPDSERLLAAVLRWCAIGRPVHGCAGFTFIFLTDQNSVYALQMMKRFPGFDFQDGVQFSLQARSVHNRIKSVNWLTVLCDALVEELGGLAAMRTALEPVCKVHDYPGGVVIQAGAYPQLGDAYSSTIPEAYRLVARYTKPVRFEGYSSSLFRVSDRLDGAEEALAWVRRFD